MAVIDTQVHVPSDERKGVYLGYTREDAEQWAAGIEDAMAVFGEDTYAIVPTVTDRRWAVEDTVYEAALDDTTVAVPVRAVEVSGPGDVQVIGRYDPSFFDYDVPHSDEEKPRYVDAVIDHTDEYDNATVIGHPFARDGGLLRNEPRDGAVYEQLRKAAADLDMYTDQYGNAWLANFRESPWRHLNAAYKDHFGFNQEWDVTADSPIRDVGCSDAMDSGLVGSGASRNRAYDDLDDLDDVKELLNDPETQTLATAINRGKIWRKIGSGIGPVKRTYDWING